MAERKGIGASQAEGGRLGGFVLYTKNGHLIFENNAFNVHHDRIEASEALPVGAVTVGYDFTPKPQPGVQRGLWPYPGAGTIRLLVNGKPVAEGQVAAYPTTPAAFAESFDIGIDRNSPVSTDPAASQRYSEALGEVRLDLP